MKKVTIEGIMQRGNDYVEVEIENHEFSKHAPHVIDDVRLQGACVKISYKEETVVVKAEDLLRAAGFFTESQKIRNA